MNTDSCCTPRKPSDKTPGHKTAVSTTPTDKRATIEFDLCDIPGGIATVGTNRPLIPIDEESPSRNIELKPFRMMRTTVTNELFAQFIAETGYITEAENIGWSFVFYKQLPDDFKDTQAVANSQWWRKVEGASWKKINGCSTALEPAHPAVHISWNDANAFARWAGGRLPTEPEWEHAARGGAADVLFPWGNKEPDDSSFQPCNIWQGNFPVTNTCSDGFAATAPAKSFEANGYGLYNMVGNVWEWSSGRFKIAGRSAQSKQHAKHYKGCKLLKGGSYLCHKSYCFRYRISARTGNTPDSTTTHQGFRLVFDL